MKRNTGNAAAIVLIIIGVLIVGGWMFMSRSNLDLDSSLTATSTPSTPTAKINGKTLDLIVADTEETREMGLGGRTSLPQNQAMLFVFDVPDTYEFWMKDMKIPIDIIWLDKDFRIVHIASDVHPETYPDETFVPDTEALYVLETNALFALQNNLKVGDAVEINLKK